MNEEKLTLLVVDDDNVIRTVLVMFGQSKGYQVIEARNGLEALVALEDTTPDLILSDLEMPKMGGLELLKELADRNFEYPIIMMTGHGTIEYAINAMKNGASDFLTKPIDLDYMNKVINRVLERSTMERKIKEQQRQLDQDLEHAAMIQKKLLPNPIETPYFSFQYRFQPLIAIGGDYITVHQYNEGKIAIALYDVCGHGVSAALTAQLLHSELKTRMSEYRPPSNIIDMINRFFLQTIDNTNMFATMVVALIDIEDQRMTVTSAGHPELFVYKNGQPSLNVIKNNIPVVGVIPKILRDRSETIVELSPGDRIILYTDGFIESHNNNNEMLQHEGFKAMLERHISLPPKEFLSAVFDDLALYQADDQSDDLTLVAVDVKQKPNE